MTATPASDAKIAGLLLAAGRSTRMGEINKLLIERDGRALVARTADSLIEAGLAPILAVTGFAAPDIERGLAQRPLVRLDNPDHVRGMGTSIAVGARWLLAHAPEIAGVAIAVGDLPLLTAAEVASLAAAFRASGPGAIVRPVSGDRVGHPVIWHRDYLAELAALDDDQGARPLLQRHKDRVRSVEIATPGPYADLDTPADLTALGWTGPDETR